MKRLWLASLLLLTFGATKAPTPRASLFIALGIGLGITAWLVQRRPERRPMARALVLGLACLLLGAKWVQDRETWDPFQVLLFVGFGSLDLAALEPEATESEPTAPEAAAQEHRS